MPDLPHPTRIWADQGYTGPTMATAAARAGTAVEIIRGLRPSGGFRVQPRRWVVARTHGWINRNRWLTRQYQTTPAAHEDFLMISQIVLPLHQLDHGQLFDRL